jgi:hypothetical protein
MKKDKKIAAIQLSKNISEYEKQALIFCIKYDTEIKVDFLKKDFYFQDDKEKRNIYQFIIKRNNKSYSSTFGDSIHNTKENKKIPSKYDILTAIEKYDPIDFNDFCANYGYDTDSRKAYSIYEKCKEQAKAINDIFSDCIDELSEIQ